MTKLERIQNVLELRDGVISRKNGRALTWTVRKDGYTICGIGRGITVLGHQAVMALHDGILPPMIDHINGDRKDNRRENLREATYTTNAQNQSTSSTNKAKHKNVYRQKDQWVVRMRVNRVMRTFGKFDDLEDAIHHARNIRAEICGELRD